MDGKVCSKCGICKPMDGFYKDKRLKDGLGSNCKTCMRAASTKWKAENQEKVQEGIRQYRELNPEKYRELKKQSDARQYVKNREKRLKKQNEWRIKNPESYARWCKANPNKMHEYRAKRRARMLQVFHVPYNREEIRKRDKGICHLCGNRVKGNKYHLDHVIPVSKGGSDTPDNVRLACPPCNLRKHNTILGQISLFEYVRQQQRNV